MFGVSVVSMPKVHGPLLRREGMPAQGLSPQVKNTPWGETRGARKREVSNGILVV